MKLSKYGISLSRVGAEDLEMIRHYRNDTVLNRFMKYKKFISPTEQINWFDSINNNNNYFFLINCANKQVGYTHLKNIDTRTSTGEGGMYIWDNNFSGSGMVFCAANILLEFFFETISLIQYCDIYIHQENRTAIEYNKLLGFSTLSADGDFIHMQQTRTSYIENKQRLDLMLSKIVPLKSILIIEGKRAANQLEVINKLFD